MGAAQLKEAALAEQRRRVEAGITDDVADVMPLQPPALSSAALAGRRLEICWGTYYVEGQKGREKMWCPCTVVTGWRTARWTRDGMGKRSRRK